ncbi:class I adenylate-forming enzyme family protein [Paraburkholderia rhizosphaerae]|uniref:Acyl-CoA synthetase (AMP-forming)/AMP-acid ligase II n=1 Tax=Paraburkholderia rhizosphaerae TaxID=480658 RepID=A0A4R8LYS6_9BURK|nr:AMP-binding protein [Paraburkholderia rhizosphaerae]TDY53222.1 acyl-CoA synthetase (AMP-forming)/AMP-acid ligase II [Paraburkholderia rhizosphaerae]
MSHPPYPRASDSAQLRADVVVDAAALLASLPARICAIPVASATRHPEHLALIEDTRRLTYAQLAAAIDVAAATLRELGVRGGDRVMIVAENCVAQIVLLFATAQLDAWALLCNARLATTELDAISKHARPRMTVFTTEASAHAAQHAQRCGAQPAPPSAYALESRIGAWSYTVDPDALTEPFEVAGEYQCAALIYTTGTTGTPKGVMLSHRNLLFIAAMSSTLRRVDPDDVVYTVLPVSHVYGLASVCLASLYAGATLRLAPRFAPEAVRVALAEERVSIFQGVPAMHAKVLDYLRTQRLRWSAPRLRFAYSGGSPLDATLKARVEAVYGVALHNGYGMTETSPTVAHTLLDAPRTDCSVGPPIPGIDVRFVAPDGADVGRGDVGELWVRGPNVMLGYYRAAAQTRAAVSEDGWLKTGDLATQDPDGAMHIVGRSKELIIRSGFNVYPAEVEQVLNAHSDVVQSAVIGRPASDGDEEVVAFVELLAGAHVSPAQLVEWCGTRLAPYKRPVEVKVLDALPAASTGKILKHKLRDLV